MQILMFTDDHALHRNKTYCTLLLSPLVLAQGRCLEGYVPMIIQCHEYTVPLRYYRYSGAMGSLYVLECALSIALGC